MIDLGQLARTIWGRTSVWFKEKVDRFGFGAYHVERVDDLPKRLRRRTLYVVTEGRIDIQASIFCPRGRCREVLNMNLLPDDYPMWTLSSGPTGTPSLRPSVWRRPGCGCHFWLRDGRVEWCP